MSPISMYCESNTELLSFKALKPHSYNSLVIKFLPFLEKNTE